MVIYVRVHKVRMEYIKGIDVCNVVWQHPNTIFWQKMSPLLQCFSMVSPKLVDVFVYLLV